MVSALIFDVDGTLAETEEAHRRAFNETFAARRVDWNWSQETYRELLKTAGGKERMARHREVMGFGPTEDEIAMLHEIKTRRYVEIITGGQVPLRPGVARLIANARAAGMKLAIATTTNRPNVDALIRAQLGADPDHLFDAIAAGDEVAAKKPAPDVFELALNRLHLPPEACIAFEDSEVGLRSAQAAGLRVVVTPSAYTDGGDFSSAEWVLPDLSHPLPPEITEGLGQSAAIS